MAWHRRIPRPACALRRSDQRPRASRRRRCATRFCRGFPRNRRSRCRPETPTSRSPAIPHHSSPWFASHRSCRLRNRSRAGLRRRARGTAWLLRPLGRRLDVPPIRRRWVPFPILLGRRQGLDPRPPLPCRQSVRCQETKRRDRSADPTLRHRRRRSAGWSYSNNRHRA